MHEIVPLPALSEQAKTFFSKILTGWNPAVPYDEINHESLLMPRAE